MVLPGLAYYLGADSLASALARITWWQFLVICAVHGASVLADTVGWRHTLPPGQRPALHRLARAKVAGDAMNVLTALGAVGGEPTKAWLLRRDVPYETSVPSLILAKTSLVVAQALLLTVGIVVAWTTGIASATLLGAMGTLLLVEVIGVGGFLLVQVTGVVGWTGRLFAGAGAGGLQTAQHLDAALRGFYHHHWRSFLRSTGFHFMGWLLGALEAFVVLLSFGLPASLPAATVIEALGSGVRFATFFVPASLGTLEGANAAAFTAFDWTASSGLAFALVRRARQAVWIGLGVVILVVSGFPRMLVGRRSGQGSPCAPLGTASATAAQVD